VADNAHRCLLIADSTIDSLAGLLGNNPSAPLVEPVLAPFDQVVPTLIDPNLDCWQHPPDSALIWTRPERVSDAFARLMRFETVPIEEILPEVDTFADQIISAADRVRFTLVPTWTLPTYYRGRGLLDMQKGGVARALTAMNLRLTERLESVSNTYVLDSNRWIAAGGKRAFNPKLWLMGKIAFGDDVFAAAAADIKAAIRAIDGQARKLIIVDLDDTLWGGIIGEIGREAIRLGGHDPIGEAYAAFQRALKALTNRGILLGIVSKNSESIAMEAIESHPEMVLGPDNFAGWRINWEDKARNIAELVTELNLGLQSVVFIDDNPVERDRVRAALPEVLVPEWPNDPMLYASTLLAMDCFDTATVTAEDAARTAMYAAERKRTSAMQQVGSVEDWLRSLETTVRIEPLTDTNRERTVQLLNKTNQMNLSTRRLTDKELQDWLAQPNRALWTFRVADRFGDSGLTGIVSAEIDGATAHIVDFLLSCRVMGRRVEETMLHTVIAWAVSQGAKGVEAVFRPTEKNRPCREFFDRSPLAHDPSADRYTWSTDTSYPPPEAITIVRD